MPRDTYGTQETAAAVPKSSTLAASSEQSNVNLPTSHTVRHTVRRGFHNYFVTHLPSSSLHPDSASRIGLHHKLPRAAAAPHVAEPGAAPAVSPPHIPPNRDLTVVRIPLKSAKHHFGAADSRGSRPYNEDTHQAGTIDMPAFAKRAPISLVRSSAKKSGEATPADSAFGDPQIFYFGVFDGHGGTQCSEFLKNELHGYIEEAADEFGLKSSLRVRKSRKPLTNADQRMNTMLLSDSEAGGAQKLEGVAMKSSQEVLARAQLPGTNEHGAIQEVDHPENPMKGEDPVPVKASQSKALRLQKELVEEYKNTIGGYFRRFTPPYFTYKTEHPDGPEPAVSIESVLTYAFLRADLDFVAAQARKPDPDDPYVSDVAVNNDEILGRPYHMPPSGHYIGGSSRFKGGSTASVALISTPTPAPFWHPAASSTLLVGHVGDTRILLCETATGLARPLTSDHHPSAPAESHRLRRFAASLVADSFGEERIQGLANSRAFGDMQSKRLGVSAEPEVARVELGPAQYSFLALVSDGVSGTLGDQEIVDVVKDANTPEQGARDVVAYATEVSSSGDNATCLVVRLGGWERRSEGGLGSLGTKEIRDYRRNEALDPRRGRR
ncbi:Protein phosphatase 2C 6 [Diatrype stigma]|uniref:Protein phosphatase 2C 6 n=1 Tax=Diatrype stigma TaxID=117547 RepID=A0AAN9UUS1_9PEZI